jgi:hypothetical protein
MILFGGRLMVGLQVLVLAIGVRIPASEQRKNSLRSSRGKPCYIHILSHGDRRSLYAIRGSSVVEQLAVNHQWHSQHSCEQASGRSPIGNVKAALSGNAEVNNEVNCPA